MSTTNVTAVNSEGMDVCVMTVNTSLFHSPAINVRMRLPGLNADDNSATRDVYNALCRSDITRLPEQYKLQNTLLSEILKIKENVYFYDETLNYNAKTKDKVYFSFMIANVSITKGEEAIIRILKEHSFQISPPELK